MVRMPSIPFLDNGHSDEHSGYQSDASEAKGHVDRAAFFWIQTTNRETLEVKQKKIKILHKTPSFFCKNGTFISKQESFHVFDFIKKYLSFFQTF